MYQLMKANVLASRAGAQWVEQDLSKRIVSEIFRTYREIYLTLDRDGVTVIVDLNQLRSEFSAYSNILPTLLQAVAGRVLETVEKLPGQKVNYIKYSDMHRSLYKMKLAKRGYILPENYPKSDLTDIEITRPAYTTDLSLIHTHCLTSVNGYYHMSDTDGSRAWIVDGGISSRVCNNNHYGLTSFLSIGKLKKIPFKPESLTTRPDSVLMERVLFTVDEDIENKFVFLILGGVLILPQDGIFYQTGDKSFEVDLNHLPYVEQIMEASSYIDLTPLNLTASELSSRIINYKEVTSDDVIRKYFSLSQSFLVIVDSDNLFSNKITLRNMQSPGIFTSYQDPLYPLVVGHGRTAEYWKVKEDGHWAVTVADSYFRNYICREQHPSTLVDITDQLICYQPQFHSQGVLLELGSYSQE